MISEFSANFDVKKITEDEQRTEEVGKVGHEVGVVVEDDRTPRSIVLHELVHLLIKVEYHRDGDDEDNGKEVGSQELSYDVIV